jgi:hypothetical protein
METYNGSQIIELCSHNQIIKWFKNLRLLIQRTHQYNKVLKFQKTLLVAEL